MSIIIWKSLATLTSTLNLTMATSFTLDQLIYFNSEPHLGLYSQNILVLLLFNRLQISILVCHFLGRWKTMIEIFIWPTWIGGVLKVRGNKFGDLGSNLRQDFVFHFVLMSLRKLWIHMFFFPQLWVNNKVDSVL